MSVRTRCPQGPPAPPTFTTVSAVPAKDWFGPSGISMYVSALPDWHSAAIGRSTTWLQNEANLYESAALKQTLRKDVGVRIFLPVPFRSGRSAGSARATGNV